MNPERADDDKSTEPLSNTRAGEEAEINASEAPEQTSWRRRLWKKYAQKGDADFERDTPEVPDGTGAST